MYNYIIGKIEEIGSNFVTVDNNGIGFNVYTPNPYSFEENKEYIDIIKKVINKCFEIESIKDSKLYISIILTNPKNIQEINREHRNIDKPTDVLSFPMFEKQELENIKLENPEVLGDVIISIEKVKEQAEEYGHGFERELAYMVVHGFYHLMGYDHMIEEDKVIMREKEENVLEKLEIVRK